MGEFSSKEQTCAGQPQLNLKKKLKAKPFFIVKSFILGIISSGQ